MAGWGFRRWDSVLLSLALLSPEESLESAALAVPGQLRWNFKGKRFFMAGVSRRDLLSSGLALSVSSLVARSAWGRQAMRLAAAPGQGTDGASAAIAPRQRLLFDFDWKFQFGHGTDPARGRGVGCGQGDFAKTGDFKFAKAGFDDSKWRTLSLPHDWAVELPFVRDEALNSHGFKPLGRRYPETSVGWYRREFEIPASDVGRRIMVEFDGAFRDVLVFVNGCFIGRNDHGYAPFSFDLTDFLAYGAKNYIVVRVDASFGDGWFYEGAGIYRHVWLTKTDVLHLAKWESVVRSEISGRDATLNLGTVVMNEGIEPENARVLWQIFDSDRGLICGNISQPQIIEPQSSVNFIANGLKLNNPKLWSVELPTLYT